MSIRAPYPLLCRAALVAVLLLLGFAAAGCSDDSGGPLDTGTAVDGGGGADGGPDGGPDGGADAGADSTAPDAGGGDLTHESLVPPGLTPEAATRLFILGDSISAGVGAGGAGNSYHALLAMNDDAAHPTETETDLESLTGAAVEIVDVAVSGATTAGLAAQTSSIRRQIDLPASGHSVVVMTIGGNDLQGAIGSPDPAGAILDTALSRIRTTVEYFQDTENFPDGASIYIANVYDPSDGEAQIPGCFFGLRLPTLVDALDVWAARYAELGAEMGFSVVDMQGAFHGHAHHYDNPENPYYDAADPTFWFSDCIHPNTRGHHELRRIFYEAMDPTYVAD